MADCYALNVVGEAAFAYYYYDWSIFHVLGDAVSSWSTDVVGSSALLSAGDRIGLFGGYESHRDRLVVGSLRSGTFISEDMVRVVLTDGSPLPTRERTVLARGSVLHVLDGPRWYAIDLADLG